MFRKTGCVSCLRISGPATPPAPASTMAAFSSLGIYCQFLKTRPRPQVFLLAEEVDTHSTWWEGSVPLTLVRMTTGGVASGEEDTAEARRSCYLLIWFCAQVTAEPRAPAASAQP